MYTTVHKYYLQYCSCPFTIWESNFLEIHYFYSSAEFTITYTRTKLFKVFQGIHQLTQKISSPMDPAPDPRQHKKCYPDPYWIVPDPPGWNQNKLNKFCFYTWDRSCGTWDVRQETGDVGQDMWDWRQETWYKICETGDMMQETWNITHDTRDLIDETWYTGMRHDTRYRNHSFRN